MDFERISYTEVANKAQELNNSSKQMETLLTEVKNLFDKIGADDVWSGTAAATTKEQFDTLSKKFPEFSSAINDCYKHLLTVVARFEAVDQTITGSN